MSDYKASITKAKTQPPAADKAVKFVLRDATVMYVKNLGYGGLKFGEKAVDGKPWMNHQYELDVLITPEIKKVLKGAHKKAGIKEFTAKEFEETFKIKPPFKADEYLVTKFYKEAFYKSGSNAGEAAPRVQFLSTTKDENLEEIGIGNGSTANLIFTVKQYSNDFGTGTSVRLGSVQVTDLIEYAVESDDTDEFDFDEPEDAFETEASGGESDDEWQG